MLESNVENVALQVVAKGSVFEDFIVFRDRLRGSKVLLDEYNRLKLACTGFAENDYRRIKSAFIERVLALEE